MSNKIIDTIASGVNTGGMLEVMDVDIVPNDEMTNNVVKLFLSIVVGFVSPLLNKWLSGLGKRKNKDRYLDRDGMI